MNPDRLDSHQPDGMYTSVATFYAALYPQLRQAAREHGYALAIHGSLTRDLDVVAIPWTEAASDQASLVTALASVAGGFSTTNKDGLPVATSKPHGRVAYTIHLGGGGGFVDLSVMPALAEGGHALCLVAISDLQAELASLRNVTVTTTHSGPPRWDPST